LPGRLAEVFLRSIRGPEVAARQSEVNVGTSIDRGYWRDVIGAEYDGLPQLSLTLAQAQRFWGLDAVTCQAVLQSFVESGYLVITSEGRYQRADRVAAGRAAGA
jgi:hypothetical protein